MQPTVGIEAGLKESDENKASITDRGHFFTWVLALRDRKAEYGGLKERLQEIFYKEVRRTQAEADTRGKFVRIPAGPFLMGSYESRTNSLSVWSTWRNTGSPGSLRLLGSTKNSGAASKTRRTFLMSFWERRGLPL